MTDTLLIYKSFLRKGNIYLQWFRTVTKTKFLIKKEKYYLR